VSGVVQADIYRWATGQLEVMPLVCPGRGPYRTDLPHCYSILADGSRRACVFWQATARANNPCERADAAALGAEMLSEGNAAKRCAVLCHRARRNVSPGT
jgi:hypothetical protein